MRRRTLNAVLAGASLLILSPVIVLLALLIRLETTGTPLFLQRRVGRGEVPFTCCKLRTMAVGTPQAGTHEVGDAYVTRVGAVLRKLKLDEMPQLWNVLAGHMDIVGPRPCLPSQAVLIAARRRAGVFAVRPGITGLGQVRGVDMSTPDRLSRIDRLYVRHRSFWFDLAIIGTTLGCCRIGHPPRGLHLVKDDFGRRTSFRH